ncbi:hypothetical protein HZA76_00015 [Candidatus Roizmanbacteria bacterium]|nr:hypothetical protein [Candidatus Roizmanbacteria bacterium]
MTKRSLLLIVSLLLIIPLQLSLLYSSKLDQGNVAGIKTVTPKTIINSLFIGEFQFTLFGYTSPQAEVTLVGQGIADQTTADVTGYFEFTNRFLPLSPHEACLSSKDQFGRISSPTCLPPFPTQANVVIGPVIIPPTISFDKPDYFVGDEAILTGQTLPESPINLSMFTKASKFPAFSLINPVEAFSLPKISALSDDKGNFSFILPSSQAQDYRLFTQVDYQELPSANSRALSLKILPIWMIIIRFFSFIWTILGRRLLEIVILLEIAGLLAYLIRTFFSPYHIARNRVLTLYKIPLPAVEEKHELMKAHQELVKYQMGSLF